jgi:UTP-glucose-1-phosphate uridylyltransferase
MKVIIPLAGKGTRLRPHTHVTPKPMLRIAGKPVMDYVMDDVRALGGVEQVVYITGHLKEKVEAHARDDIGLPAVFVEQRVQDGTAGAVGLARPYVDQPCSSSSSTRSSTPTCRSSTPPTPTASSGRRRSRTTSASAWWSPTPTGT